MQTFNDISKLELKELQKNLAKARANLYKIQLALLNEKNHKPSELREAKKHVAHILTVINQKKQETQQ